MFCPKCGTQNPETGKFCRSCGTDLGTVAAALTGNLPKPSPQTSVGGRSGEPVTLESSLTKLFMGMAFLIISVALSFTGMGRNWWFWMLIPAFGLLATGLAHLAHLKKLEKQNASYSPGGGRHALSSREPSANDSQPNSALPPTRTDYVSPGAAVSGARQAAVYDTGEFAAPTSVTEGTTRHLEINKDGETMTLPKK
jgi:hypothetical protein